MDKSTGNENPRKNHSREGRCWHDKYLYRTLLQGPVRGTVKPVTMPLLPVCLLPINPNWNFPHTHPECIG